VEPVDPLLVPPTPGLLGDIAPVPELLVPAPELVLPVPELVLPVPVLPVLLLPVLLLRSWRWQSSFAMPVSASQRVELAPPELLLESEPVLLLVSPGFDEVLPGVLGLVVPGLVVLGLVVPLGLWVWATARLAAPRNAAATAA
jgi:hypothetical protein